MKILIVHNSYKQSGGEDTVVEQEIASLRNNSCDVIEYRRNNNEANNFPLYKKMLIPIQSVWSHYAQNELRQIITKERPNIVHFHNTFFLISPSIYWLCKGMRIPVVQTLHNYRLVCPRADLFRNNSPCELCITKTFPFPALYYKCYHESIVDTTLVSSITAFHKLIRTYQKCIDAFIVFSEFASQKFVAGGLPESKIFIKPNFIDIQTYSKKAESGSYFLFVGRYSKEKNIRFLIESWKSLEEIPLKLVGDGPEYYDVMNNVQKFNRGNIEILGHQKRTAVFELMKDARALVFPSAWYEGFPMTILEAFSSSLPVIATDLGIMKEMIQHQKNGLLFSLNDRSDFSEKIRWAWKNETEMKIMGEFAYNCAKELYSPQKNISVLTEIYKSLLNKSK